MKNPNRLVCMLVVLLASFALSARARGTPKNTYTITNAPEWKLSMAFIITRPMRPITVTI